MSPLLYLLSIVGLDILGLFFNIRMLLGCVRKENRYPTPWVICQFVFQVTILVAVTVDAWNKHVDENYEYCCLLKELQRTAVFLAVCNYAQLQAVSLDKPEHPLEQKIRSTSPLKLVLATLGMTITNVAILWPLLRFIETLVSYASAVTIIYVMILNYVGLRLFFLLSGTIIKWTEPKDILYMNKQETQASLPLKEVCECFSVFTVYYLLIPCYLVWNFEFILEYYFLSDHYILMGFLNIVYGTFIPAFVTGPANIFTSKGNEVRSESSLRESSLEAGVVHMRRDFKRDFERVEYLLSLPVT